MFKRASRSYVTHVRIKVKSCLWALTHHHCCQCWHTSWSWFLFLKKMSFFSGGRRQFHLFFFFDWSNKSRKRELFGFSPSDVRRRQIEPVSHHKMLTLLQDWKTPPLFFQESRNLKVKGQGRTKGVSCSGHVLIPWWFFFFFFNFILFSKGASHPWQNLKVQDWTSSF